MLRQGRFPGRNEIGDGRVSALWLRSSGHVQHFCDRLG